MAGLPLGVVPAPTLPTLGASALTAWTSRTRRCLGAFQLGDVLAAAFASRRSGDDRGVSLALGLDDKAITARMSSTQARILARALIEAAAAVDQAQRPVLTRGGAHHG
jgi:hypothetical protein